MLSSTMLTANDTRDESRLKIPELFASVCTLKSVCVCVRVCVRVLRKYRRIFEKKLN